MNALNNGGSYANGGGGSYAQNIQEDVDAMISAAAEATTAAQLALSSVMDDDKNITNTGAYNAIQAFSGAVYGSTEPTGFTGAINAVVENLSGGSFESTLTGSISSATDLQTSGVVSGNITADISSFDPVNNT
ncbi:MAG: hypothetical protein U9Q15_04005 [Patescibacteria group bacterium]|nr:hypothetical protein [Patescibacteria group bacterium]